MEEAAKIVKPPTKAGFASFKEVIKEPEETHEVVEPFNPSGKPARYYFSIYEHLEPYMKDKTVATVYYDEGDNNIHIEYASTKKARVTTILGSDYQIEGTTTVMSRTEFPKEWALNIHKAGDLLENLRATEPVREYNY
jgi:hypothetical protein|tara:strand:+ start:232 stop:645 length:414 start_codon:yes stop_codon:yes gene_type:complete